MNANEPYNFLTTCTVVHGESRKERLLEGSGRRQSIWMRNRGGERVRNTSHRMCTNGIIDGVIMEQYFNRTKLHIFSRPRPVEEVKMCGDSTPGDCSRAVANRSLGMFRSAIQVKTNNRERNVHGTDGDSTSNRNDVRTEEDM